MAPETLEGTLTVTPRTQRVPHLQTVPWFSGERQLIPMAEGDSRTLQAQLEILCCLGMLWDVSIGGPGPRGQGDACREGELGPGSRPPSSPLRGGPSPPASRTILVTPEGTPSQCPGSCSEMQIWPVSLFTSSRSPQDFALKQFTC